MIAACIRVKNGGDLHMKVKVARIMYIGMGVLALTAGITAGQTAAASTASPVKTLIVTFPHSATRQGITAEKNAVLSAHPGLKVVRNYPAVPLIIVKASSSDAAALASDRHVLSVQPERNYQRTPLAAPSVSPVGAIIKSGNVGMGIMQWGDLNVPDQAPSSGGTTTYGLRYLPTGNEFTGPGCPCEGWGVADPALKVSGYADESTGTAGLRLISFTHTATTATSEVEAGSVFDVVNAYSPVTGVPDLFMDTVTITNSTSKTLCRVLYRRVVDWDIEPTAFDEFVTIQGLGSTPGLRSTTNDGFDSPDPLSPSHSFGATGNFVRYGPTDQGAQFNFNLGSLAAHHSITFTEYYGAAANQAQADADLAQVKAKAYSLGEPASSSDGSPNTAILAFAGL
jgi:hypothetical protein